jgi:CheY-like chemotaxis protein
MGPRSPSHQRTARVIVADPNHRTRLQYRESLKPTGCDIVEAADGREALVSALVQRPSLVIADTWLPIVDGCALCELLRRDSLTRRVPILVTAEQRAAEIDRARAAGADAVLTKPVAPEVLVNEVQRWLRPVPKPAAKATPRRRATDSGVQELPASFPRERRAEPRHPGLQTQTTTPPLSPPLVCCPLCGVSLAFKRSVVGGISSSHWEQWDYYECPTGCGTFQYRHRARKLQRVG